jgi:N-acetylglutamate synthase-like GNAT family acetyltransferase
MRLARRTGQGADSSWHIRRASFEDIPDMLRLIERAIEHGCRFHYGADQRRAVFLGYAQSLFLEVMLPFEMAIAEVRGRMVAAAQLDPHDGRLRGLFVDAHEQGHGYGRDLLAWSERRALAHHLPRLHGAMSLNAVPFYTRAGFEPAPGNRLIRHGQSTVPVLPMEKRLR